MIIFLSGSPKCSGQQKKRPELCPTDVFREPSDLPHLVYLCLSKIIIYNNNKSSSLVQLHQEKNACRVSLLYFLFIKHSFGRVCFCKPSHQWQPICSHFFRDSLTLLHVCIYMYTTQRFPVLVSVDSRWTSGRRRKSNDLGKGEKVACTSKLVWNGLALLPHMPGIYE